MGYFKDHKGNNSIMRLAFAWLIVNATFMGWFVLTFGSGDVGAAAAIFGTVSGVATGLKIMQNQQEK